MAEDRKQRKGARVRPFFTRPSRRIEGGAGVSVSAHAQERMTASEIIYGVHPVLEAIRAKRRRCHEVFLARGKREVDFVRIEEEARRHGVPVQSFAREEISKRARTEKHQGVAARVDPFRYAVLEELLEMATKDLRKAFIVLLDGITDPHNVGSLIRTAHLLGVHGIVVPRDNAASITPTVVKASAGATEYLAIAQVTNIAKTMEHLKDVGFWISGADIGGAKTIYQYDFTGHHVGVVLGSEGSGLRRLVRESCDEILSIPMEGKVGSYNVSVAGAIFMGEVARQRRLAEQARTVPKAL
jgi:23S rRNA (guanosine2251-2'-O)-methyltransferase